MSGLFNRNFSPARPVSPQIRNTPDILSESHYLQELLTERQKLAPFMPVLPICTRLLNQELMRVSGLLPNHFGELENLRRRSPSPNPMASPYPIANNGIIGWNGNMNQERLGFPHGMLMDLDTAEINRHSFPVKKIVRLDIPVDAYPTFNFVGRLLGPRGNSLKRVEAQTGCRVYIRGQGSIKDPEKDKTEKAIGEGGSDGVLQELISDRKSHGPSWLIGRHTNSAKVSKDAPTASTYIHEMAAKIREDIVDEVEAKVNRKVQENLTWVLKKLGEANPDMQIDVGDLCATVCSTGGTDGTGGTRVTGGTDGTGGTRGTGGTDGTGGTRGTGGVRGTEV